MDANLLAAIRGGAKLNKVVTRDASSPIIPGTKKEETAPATGIFAEMMRKRSAMKSSSTLGATTKTNMPSNNENIKKINSQNAIKSDRPSGLLPPSVSKSVEKSSTHLPPSVKNSSGLLPPPPSSSGNGTGLLPPPPSSTGNGTGLLPPPPVSTGKAGLLPPPTTAAALQPSSTSAVVAPKKRNDPFINPKGKHDATAVLKLTSSITLEQSEIEYIRERPENKYVVSKSLNSLLLKANRVIQ